MVKGLEEIKKFILDILFPIECVGCGKGGKYICEKCSTFLGEASLICPVCQKPSFSGQRHNYCPSRHHLDGLVGVWEYEGMVRKLFHEIKYGKVRNAISELTELSFKIMTKDEARFASFFSFLFSEKPIITFVPMHDKKEWRRGFNQSKLIAEEISKITNLEVMSLLEKVKRTESQAKLDKAERVKNIEGVFNIRKDQNKIPEKLVLIDDIWTTGATMKECCKVLKKVGVKKVWGFTLARTV